jgi:hypothetical protein
LSYVDTRRETSVLSKRLTEVFQNSGIVHDLNPKIYDLDRKAFQLAALLRRFKSEDTAKWSALVEAVRGVSPDLSMVDPPRLETLERRESNARRKLLPLLSAG